MNTNSSTNMLKIYHDAKERTKLGDNIQERAGKWGDGASFGLTADP
jgi:hypothetical protein